MNVLHQKHEGLARVPGVRVRGARMGGGSVGRIHQVNLRCVLQGRQDHIREEGDEKSGATTRPGTGGDGSGA